MTDQLGSEILKLRTTRTLGLLVLAAVALSAFGVVLEMVSRSAADVARGTTQREVLSGGTSIAVFAATLAGLLSVTTEFRDGTIRPTLLVEPRRGVVLAAKLAASVLTAVVLAAACTGVAFAAGLGVLAARDVGVVLTAGQVAGLIAGPVGAACLSAAIGVALGALIRNQAGAIAALAAYAVAVDAVLFAAVPAAGRWLPGKAGDALVGRPDADLLAPAAGAAVLAVWALAFVAAAVVRTARSDI